MKEIFRFCEVVINDIRNFKFEQNQPSGSWHIGTAYQLKGTIVQFRHRQIQTVINNYYWHLDKRTDAIWPNFRTVQFVNVANLKMAALAEKIQLIYRNRFKTFFDLGKLEICYLVWM